MQQNTKFCNKLKLEIRKRALRSNTHTDTHTVMHRRKPLLAGWAQAPQNLISWALSLLSPPHIFGKHQNLS